MKKSVFRCLVPVLVLCCYAQTMQAEISQSGELSFYFAGYNELAKPEHGKILISVFLQKTTMVKKPIKAAKPLKNRNMKSRQSVLAH